MKRKTGMAETAMVILGLALALPAVAGTAVDATLPETTVVGSRIARPVAEVPAPTYVVTRDQIERSGATTLQGALSLVPGVLALNRGTGSLAQDQNVTLRGLSSQVLLMVDGVPCNSPSHGAGTAPYDLRTIPLTDVERIEVVSGSSSALYGSEATGGVINIVTRRCAGKSGGSIFAEAGTAGWLRAGLRGTVIGDDGLRATLSYARTQERGDRPVEKYTDGWYDHGTDYHADDFSLRLEKDFWRFAATAGTNRGVWQVRDGFPGHYKDSASMATQKTDYRRFHLNYDDGQTVGGLYFWKVYREYEDSFGTTEYDDRTFGGSISRRAAMLGGSGVFGLDMRVESSKVTGSLGYENSSRTELAPFFEQSWALGQRGSVDLGLRWEHWSGDDKPQDELLPRLAFSWQTGDGTLLYASAGRSFALPSFYELYAANPGWNIVSNPNLKPEKGWSYDLGVKNLTAHNPWQVGVFYSTMDDKIIYKSGAWPNPSRYENVDEWRAWGATGQVTFGFGRGWSFIPAVSYLNAEEKTASGDWERTGDPRWDLSGQLSYVYRDVTFSLTGHYYMDRDTSTLGAFKGEPSRFGTLDFATTWKDGANTVRLTVQNLTNEEVLLSSYGNIAGERRIVAGWEHRF